MTTRPRLATNVNYVNGLAALALFGVLAFVFVSAGLEPPRGFGEGAIVASIGYAMFDLVDLVPSGHGETEGFLVAFLTIAVVLDAALDGAVMLARRDEDESVVTTLADGGRPLAESSEESGATAGDEAAAADATATATGTNDAAGTDDGAATDGGEA